MEKILEHGEVKRVHIGVGIQDITPNLRDAFDLENGQKGVLITNVLEDSPAEDAGLKAGDVVVAVDDAGVKSTGQLRSKIGMRSIGDKIALKLLRDGKEKTVRVKVGEPDSFIAGDAALHKLLDGVQFEKAPDGEGVLVANLAPSSPATYSGLRTGDIIVAANKRRVRDLRSFEKALLLNDSRILLQVNRSGGSLFIVIR